MWALKASEDKAKEKERKPMGSSAFSIECAYDRGQGLPTVYSDGLETLKSRVASNWDYSYSECTFLIKYREDRGAYICKNLRIFLLYTFAQKGNLLCNNITNTLKFRNDIYNIIINICILLGRFVETYEILLNRTFSISKKTSQNIGHLLFSIIGIHLIANKILMLQFTM